MSRPLGHRAVWLGQNNEPSRFGTMLALLALLFQVTISSSPMSRMASLLAGGTAGGSICHLDTTGGQVAPKGGKSSGHTHSDCAVCQAAQLLGSMVPPIPIVFSLKSSVEQLALYTVIELVWQYRVATSHQARAPPPLV